MSAPPDEDLPEFVDRLPPPVPTPPTGETPVFDPGSLEQLLGIGDASQDLVAERYERFLAVLHVDVVGSAAYAARHGESAGRRMVQRIHESFATLVRDHKGRVVKTVGDGVLMTFPSVDAAVHVAIGMQRRALAANLRATSPEGVVEIRIGINCGSALVNDADGDVYGDMVNVAARMQGKAGARQILISEEARANLGSRHLMQPAGTLALKGRDVVLFAVDWDVPTEPMVDPDAPPTLDARYAVRERLGIGTHATVWRARDEHAGQDVAVKVINRQPILTVAVRERLEQDVLLAERLEHENVVRVRDFAIPSGGEAYVVMDLVRGETLRRRLERSSAMPPHIAALLAHELASGLAAAHAHGLVHRDLKPENIHLTDDGGVKITDFALAADTGDLREVAPGVVPGSPAYLSPEQVKGEGATPASDVFALGIVIYEVITGRLPFSASSSSAVMFRVVDGRYEDAATLVPGLDPGLAQVLRRCLETDPARRFPDGGAVREALRRALHKIGIVEPSRALTAWLISGDEASLETLLPAPSARSALRQQISLGWVATACAAVALVVFLLTRFSGDEEPRPVDPRAELVALAHSGDVPQPKLQEAESPKAGPAAVRGLAEKRPAPPPAPTPAVPVRAAAAPEEEAPTTGAGLDLSDEGLAREDAAELQRSALAESDPAADSALDDPEAEEEALAALDAVVAAGSARSPTETAPARARRATRKVVKTGMLALSVSGWADVTVDGKPLGRFPQVRRFQLPEGAHVLELHNPHRQPYRARVHVKAGQEVAHRAELIPLP